MTTKTISMTDANAAHIEAMVRTGKYANASDYVRALIRRDQERQEAQMRLADLIRQGIASGGEADLNAEEWASIRKQARKIARSQKA